jgi:hypothetical protein
VMTFKVGKQSHEALCSAKVEEEVTEGAARVFRCHLSVTLGGQAVAG